MDNIRVFLWLTLLGMAWLDVHGVGRGLRQRRRTVRQLQPIDAPPNEPALPPLTPGSEPAPQQVTQVAAPAAPTGELIRVRTDVLDVRIASQGGDLVRADLLQYPVDKNTPEPVVRLLDDAGAERWVFQTGVRSAVGGARAESPRHVSHRE